eukprot:gene244-328_t
MRSIGKNKNNMWASKWGTLILAASAVTVGAIEVNGDVTTLNEMELEYVNRGKADKLIAHHQKQIQSQFNSCQEIQDYTWNAGDERRQGPPEWGMQCLMTAVAGTEGWNERESQNVVLVILQEMVAQPNGETHLRNFLNARSEVGPLIDLQKVAVNRVFSIFTDSKSKDAPFSITAALHLTLYQYEHRSEQPILDRQALEKVFDLFYGLIERDIRFPDNSFNAERRIQTFLRDFVKGSELIDRLKVKTSDSLSQHGAPGDAVGVWLPKPILRNNRWRGIDFLDRFSFEKDSMILATDAAIFGRIWVKTSGSGTNAVHDDSTSSAVGDDGDDDDDTDEENWHPTRAQQLMKKGMKIFLAVDKKQSESYIHHDLNDSINAIVHLRELMADSERGLYLFGENPTWSVASHEKLEEILNNEIAIKLERSSPRVSEAPAKLTLSVAFTDFRKQDARKTYHGGDKIQDKTQQFFGVKSGSKALSPNMRPVSFAAGQSQKKTIDVGGETPEEKLSPRQLVKKRASQTPTVLPPVKVPVSPPPKTINTFQPAPPLGRGRHTQSQGSIHSMRAKVSKILAPGTKYKK